MMRDLTRLIPVAAAILCAGCTWPATDPAPPTPASTAPDPAPPTPASTAPVPATPAPALTGDPGRAVDKAALLDAVATAQRDARTAAATLDVLGSDRAKKGTGTAGLDFGAGPSRMYLKTTQSGGIELIVDGDTAYVKAGQLTDQKWLRSPLAKAPAAVRQVQASYDYAVLAPQVDRAVYRGVTTMGGSEARHYTLTGADLTQEVWIDAANRPLRSERATQEGIVVSAFGSFGQPVTVPSPSPSDVVDLPG